MHLSAGLAALLFAQFVQAAAIGMPESTARIGYALGVARMSVDDPQGSTEDTAILQPLRLLYTDWLDGGYRYWGELFYESASLDAGGDQIGQDVRHYGVRLSLQKQSEFVQDVMLWFGLGLQLSHSEYTRRFTVDADGFLLERFADRSETGLGMLINLAAQWRIQRDWDLNLQLEQSVAFGDGIDALSLSLGVLRRY